MKKIESIINRYYAIEEVELNMHYVDKNIKKCALYNLNILCLDVYCYIQYHSDGLKQIEYKNPREDVVITDISIIQKYVDRFNLTEQTYQSQIAWDNNNVQDETLEQKITRLGSRP